MESKALDFIVKEKCIYEKVGLQEQEITDELKNTKEQELAWQGIWKEFQELSKIDNNIPIFVKKIVNVEDN